MVNIVYKTIALLLILSGLTESRRHLTITSMDCHADPVVCVNVICNMTAIRRYVKSFEFGCTPVQPLSRLSIHMAMYRKTFSGLQPGFVDKTVNFCDIMNRNSSSHAFLQMIMTNFMPNTFKKIEKYWFNCPVATPWYIEFTQTDDVSFGSSVMAVVPEGEYKVSIRAFDIKNRTGFEWNYFFSYKN